MECEILYNAGADRYALKGLSGNTVKTRKAAELARTKLTQKSKPKVFKEKRSTISFTIETSVAERLYEIAEQDGVTISKLMQTMVRREIGENE